MEVVKHSRKVRLLSKLLKTIANSSRNFLSCKCFFYKKEEKLCVTLFAYEADRKMLPVREAELAQGKDKQGSVQILQ